MNIRVKSLPVTTAVEKEHETNTDSPYTVVAYAEYKGKNYRCYAWGFRKATDPLIPRLCAAAQAGKLFDEFTVYEDEPTLRIHARIIILSRLMNSELRKLGF